MKNERLLLEGIYAMLEEMQKRPNNSEVITPTASAVDLSEITMLIKHLGTQSQKLVVNIEEKLNGIVSIADKTAVPEEKLNRILEILQQPPANPKPRAQKHFHVIDLKSSKAVKYIFIQWIVLFLFLGWNIWLMDRNMDLRDNDLKYRYIKSENPNNNFIHHLENVFRYDRDRKEIRNIRKKVKKHENEMKKRAERIETGKQND